MQNQQSDSLSEYCKMHWQGVSPAHLSDRSCSIIRPLSRAVSAAGAAAAHAETRITAAVPGLNSSDLDRLKMRAVPACMFSVQHVVHCSSQGSTLLLCFSTSPQPVPSPNNSFGV
jgi:hypothetical protein